MKNKPAEMTVALIASQIEAASSLLKFAADDMADLISQENSIFSDELQTIMRNMHATTAVLDGNAAFLQRLDLVTDDDDAGDAGETQDQWFAQQG